MPAELRPFIFSPSIGTWVEDRAEHTPADAPASITLITWNVWFAPYSFEPRLQALLEVIHARRPDVICLQEIIPESLEILLAEPWVRDEYRISDASGATLDAYGVVVLSRLPVRALALHDLPSHMGRRLLVAEIGAGPHSLVVGTVHLESLKPNRDVRAEQLAEVFPRLKAAGADCLLAGDFNFCSSWAAENANLDPEFTDLWPALHGRAPGYTEDTDINAMLRNVKRKEKLVRFDRVLLRSAGGAWRPRSIELLGTEPINEETPDVFPSDHFGLAAKIVPGAVAARTR
jgi:tyrosyl-DNA phosphodiesterase 2